VLTLTALTDAEYLISSVALSIDEYYAGVGESPGVWAGKWAEELGLSGVVEAEQLRALVEGRDPVSGAELLAGNRERSVRAFDLTFSAPKSVSLLWAFASEPVAEVVTAAHREAVEEALSFLEDRAAVARVQSVGVRRRVATQGWVVDAFTHRTSREGDPQLHTHCLAPNLVRRQSDGKFVAFDAGPLFDWCRAAGSVYQAHLQRAMSLRLGVVWGPDRHNTREIVGLSREQLRAFSKRSAQIEAELEARGDLYGSPALRMRADDEASLATRRAKDHSLTPSVLAARWQAEAAEVGLPVGAVLERLVCWGEPALEPPSAEELTAALIDPETGLCSRSARFTEADVFEHLCSLSGGRLSLDEIKVLATTFLSSGQVVRLTPNAEEGRRRPAEWSTAAHRALEDRVLALIDALAGRDGPVVEAETVEAALAAEPGLGEDQVAAVRTLTGEGAALRAVLSPAGFGKTTMLHTAARAATDGRSVVAVATTAKAVSELASAGLDARTIARLQLQLREMPLASGTVVVLDEVSQTPTREAEAVLAAVAACPGGSLWVLGDPRQSQPVGAGGLADEIARLAAEGRVVSGLLTVNRRQVDRADQEALRLLRAGQVIRSQQLRAEWGWEHELATPGQTREAMAQAICADIHASGPEQVAALVVSNADGEDLADRIRSNLSAAGLLAGPAITGPGWTAEREYRAGDRVLLHARSGRSRDRLVNGTTAPVTNVDGQGMTVRLDGGDAAVLPVGFVQGTRKDGSPNLSHAWARTVDGAQGGTWESCHLLGSSALDAYRGYTGQSRSRQPTHTWNTTKVTVVDHGGLLADQRDGAELVADALARRTNPRLAARSDPWALDRVLRAKIAEHKRVLAAKPADPATCSAMPPRSWRWPKRNGGTWTPSLATRRSGSKALARSPG
jgi:conjugative relaxase-like TrwC/TraI family protein